MSTTSPITSESFAESPVPECAAAPAIAPTYLYPANGTLADLQSHLGDIPLERIRLVPPPGYATEEDVVRLAETGEGACELVDGVLVEKTVGAWESRLGAIIEYFIERYLDANPIGFTLGEKGALRTVAPRVRMPDTCFVSWTKVPGNDFPRVGVLPFGPDLAVEVLSPSNTRREMVRKLEEYFQSGTQLVWYIDPVNRTVKAYTTVDQCVDLTEKDALDGMDVVPGFRLPLAELFEEAGPREE
jgi:Uma2 family endonuclease